MKKKARDLLHPILDGCSPLNEDIDLVYTWVNGSEIAFKEQAFHQPDFLTKTYMHPKLEPQVLRALFKGF